MLYQLCFEAQRCTPQGVKQCDFVVGDFGTGVRRLTCFWKPSNLSESREVIKVHKIDKFFLCAVSFEGTSVIRLVGGQHTYEGRVEVFYDGQWGTVCDDYWDANDATVACRQLGYADGTVLQSSSYTTGTGQIWLDDVQCDGTEDSVWSCSHLTVGVHNCAHSEDAGVRCQTLSRSIIY